jgi:hypothetical protein
VFNQILIRCIGKAKMGFVHGARQREISSPPRETEKQNAKSNPELVKNVESNIEKQTRETTKIQLFYSIDDSQLIYKERDANMGHVRSKRCDKEMCLLTNQPTYIIT